MKVLFGIIIVFLLTLAILLCIGIGIGFALHLILPTIDLGIGILAGLLATGISIYFLTGLISSAPEENEEKAGENRLSEAIYLIESGGLRRRRRRKASR